MTLNVFLRVFLAKCWDSDLEHIVSIVHVHVVNIHLFHSNPLSALTGRFLVVVHSSADLPGLARWFRLVVKYQASSRSAGYFALSRWSLHHF